MRQPVPQLGPNSSSGALGAILLLLLVLFVLPLAARPHLPKFRNQPPGQKQDRRRGKGRQEQEPEYRRPAPPPREPARRQRLEPAGRPVLLFGVLLLLIETDNVGREDARHGRDGQQDERDDGEEGRNLGQLEAGARVPVLEEAVDLEKVERCVRLGGVCTLHTSAR